MKTKMKTRSPAILLLAVLTLLLPACAAHQAVGGGAGGGSTYVWPRGAQAEYVLSNFQTQKVEIPGGGEQVLSNSSTIDLKVVATGDRDYAVTYTGGAAQHDDAAELGQPTPDISRLVGLTSQVRLDERGQVVEATGLEGNSYVIDSGGVAPFRELNIQVVFPYLPEGRLSAGAQWSREYGFTIVQMDGTILSFKVKDDFTCVEETLFEGTPAWKIALASSQNVTGSGDIGAPMELAMSGTGQADIYVARDTAMMLGNEWKGTFSGYISVQDLSIPVSISQATNVKKK
jgi:hypothetical protein